MVKKFMRFALIYSKKYPVGFKVAKRFKEIAFMPQIPVIELKKEVLFTNIIKNIFLELKNIDFIVFLSVHKSKDNKPSLCLHAPGNLRNANFGGKEGKVCMTSAFIMKYLFQRLNYFAQENEIVKERYNVSLEATHHGPLTNIPCCFLEIGSTDEEYNDVNAIGVVVKTIISLQNYKINYSWIPAIAIGGPHYAPNFNKIQLNSNYAISHIIPNYSLPLTESMLTEAEAKTLEHVKNVLIDWKGCGSSEERSKYFTLIEKLGFEIKRTDKVK